MPLAKNTIENFIFAPYLILQLVTDSNLLILAFSSKHSWVCPKLANWRWTHVILLIGPSLCSDSTNNLLNIYLISPDIA